jgi:hypothetical protein
MKLNNSYPVVCLLDQVFLGQVVNGAPHVLKIEKRNNELGVKERLYETRCASRLRLNPRLRYDRVRVKLLYVKEKERRM